MVEYLNLKGLNVNLSTSKKEIMKREIILASKSPRRKQLLRHLKFKFKTYESNIDEKKYRFGYPSLIVKRLSYLKAKAVSKFVKNKIIIGCDTIVVLGRGNKRKIISKPKNKKDAIKILLTLSGTTHYVYTGVTIIDQNRKKILVDYEKSRVKLRRLSLKEIKQIAGKHLDKAGAYAIQENNDRFVENLEGSYTNVVGFPVERFKEMIKHLEVC